MTLKVSKALHLVSLKLSNLTTPSLRRLGIIQSLPDFLLRESRFSADSCSAERMSFAAAKQRPRLQSNQQMLDGAAPCIRRFLPKPPSGHRGCRGSPTQTHNLITGYISHCFKSSYARDSFCQRKRRWPFDVKNGVKRIIRKLPAER